MGCSNRKLPSQFLHMKSEALTICVIRHSAQRAANNTKISHASYTFPVTVHTMAARTLRIGMNIPTFSQTIMSYPIDTPQASSPATASAVKSSPPAAASSKLSPPLSV